MTGYKKAINVGPVCFIFETARAPRHFLLVEGLRAPYEKIVNVYSIISKAPRHGGGMEAITSIK